MVNIFPNLIAQTRSLDPAKKEIVDGVPTIKGFEAIFENVISVVLSLGAIALFIVLISAGFKFLTSGGDPKSAEGAKNTLTAALTGIVLLVVSYLILVFIEKFTGFQVTIFKITR